MNNYGIHHDSGKAAKGPRACATCARAKSRCVPGPVPDICERCHRLNKACSSQVPAPPRRKKEPRPNRVAELERRLEDLRTKLQPVVEAQNQSLQHDDVEQWQGQGQWPEPEPEQDSTPERQQPTPPPTDQQGPSGSNKPRRKGCKLPTFIHIFPTEEAGRRRRNGEGDGQEPTRNLTIRDSSCNLDSTTRSLGSVQLGQDDHHLRQQQQQSHQQSQPQHHGGGLANSVPGPGSKTQKPHDTLKTVSRDAAWPDPGEAAALLNAYKSKLEPIFPFILMPSDATAEHIRQRKPLLWKAVMMAACYTDGERQVVMGTQLLKDVMVASLTEPFRSHELLQCLVLLLAWFHYNLNSFQITNLLFLARGICAFMGFHEAQSGPANMAPEGRQTPTSLEEMRTFAGIYYLVTLVFTTNKKPDALMNTSYLDTCCQVLQARMEYASDELLVRLVKIQQLSQAIFLTMSLRSNSGQADAASLKIVTRNFQQQLDAFEQGLTPRLRGISALMNHFYVAQIMLSEVGLHEAARAGGMAGEPRQQQQQQQQQEHQEQTDTSLSPMDRLEMLQACTQACKAFMYNRFERVGSNGRKFSPIFCCLSSFDFIYAFTTSIRLIMVQVPGWDRDAARAELQLIKVINHQLGYIEALMRARVRSRPDPPLVASGNTAARGPGRPAIATTGGLPVMVMTTAQDGGGDGAGMKRVDPFEKIRQRLLLIRGALETEATDAVQRVLAVQDLSVGLGGAASAAPVAAAAATATATATAEAPTATTTMTSVHSGGGDSGVDFLAAEMDIDSWAYLFEPNDDWDTTAPLPDWGRSGAFWG